MAALWYTVRGVSGQEKKIKQYLESEIKRLKMSGYIEDIVIPLEKVFEMRGGKKRIRERSSFPGYIFIHATLQPEVIQMIKDVPSVIGFLGTPPVPLREAEINKILGKISELSQAGEVMENPFSQGESIKVMDGPFNGFTGVVEEIFDDKKKLKVTVKIFGRNTPLELNYLQVERI